MQSVLRSLRGRILLGYFILVIIIASVGMWAAINFAHLNRVLTDVTRENYVSVLAAENMVAAIERQDSAELLLLLGEVRGGVDIYQIGKREFADWLLKEKRNITLPNEGSLVRRIERDYRRYDSRYATLHGLILAGKTGEARRLYLMEIDPLFRGIRHDLQDLLLMNHQALMDGNQRSKRSAWRATVSTVVVASAAIVLAILFGLGISGAVVRPTVRLTEAVRRIRAGNLQGGLEVTSTDEIGELALEFNSMVLRLRAYEEALTGKVAAEQQKALTIIEAIDDGVLLTDWHHRVVMLNPAAEIILGVASAEAMGRDICEVTKQPILRRMIDEALANGKASHNRTIVTESGESRRFYDAEVVPLKAERESRRNEGNLGMVVLLKDVSYFKRIEKLKSDFLSDVSHEIRTPLTSITMGVGLLRESKTLASLARERDLLAMVSTEAERLTSLVEELLLLSRLESGKTRLNLKETDLSLLIERTSAAFRPQAESKGIELRTEIDRGLPHILTDQDKLQSVVSNLITNALRYTPKGGSVAIGADRHGDGCRISVSDTGPGIPSSAAEKIFDRFFQLEDRPGGQMGLGLPISKAIVEAHGGKIWIESEPKKGTVFRFTLPGRIPAGEGDKKEGEGL
ncbi:MAG: ATP-binding protein [Bacteroidota bacterium]